MSTTQEMRVCKPCNRNTIHLIPSGHHVVHCLLTLFTLGLWIPVWILAGLAGNKASCTKCGETQAARAFQTPGLLIIGSLILAAKVMA